MNMIFEKAGNWPRLRSAELVRFINIKYFIKNYAINRRILIGSVIKH